VDRSDVLAAEGGGGPAQGVVEQGVVPNSGGPVGGVSVGKVTQPGTAVPTAGTGGGTAAVTGSHPGPTTGTSIGTGVTGPSHAAASRGCAKQGAPVVIGQVGAFSGLVGANNQGAVRTLPVWVRDVNARGGLGCHPVTLYQKDTASDPARSEAAVKEMVESKNAVALVANYAPLDVQGFRKGVEEEHIAAVGGDQVTPDWHKSPELFPVGGNERAQFAGSVKALGAKGVKRIAIFYCIESTACTAFRDTLDRDGYAKKFGMSIVYESQISLTQNDFTSVCQSAKTAGAQAIVFAGDAGGVSRTARSCNTVGLTVPIAITASQATFDPNDQNLQRATVSMAAPVFPFTQGGDNAAEKDFLAAIARYNPSATIDAASALTWSSAKMLERAVALLGPSVQSGPLTRDLIHKGLGLVKNETLGGLIPPTSYTFGQAQAAENFCFAPMAFGSPGRFSAPQGTRFSCI
jgi:ABC-type branched-subunit amino acid transport system substrate-binding protein